MMVARDVTSMKHMEKPTGSVVMRVGHRDVATFLGPPPMINEKPGIALRYTGGRSEKLNAVVVARYYIIMYHVIIE